MRWNKTVEGVRVVESDRVKLRAFEVVDFEVNKHGSI